MTYLDHDGFAVPDARAFEAIVHMFSRATKDKVRIMNGFRFRV
jgi:hypothetical protein